MSIRLPVLDAKPSNVYYFANKSLYKQETPLTDDLSTESGQTLGIDKNHSLLNSNTIGSLPPNLENARRLEMPIGRKAEFLPSILGNTSQLGRSRPTSQANVSDNNINIHSTNLASSRQATGHSPASEYRMGVPGYVPIVPAHKEQRRSLRANPGPPTFSIVLDEKPKNGGRRGSNLPPIQFINNFPNYVPQQNNLSRVENFSPQLNEVLNEQIFESSPSSGTKDSAQSSMSPTLRVQNVKSDKNNFSNAATPRGSIPFSPRSLNKINEFPVVPVIMDQKFDSLRLVKDNSQKEHLYSLFGATLANVPPELKKSPLQKARNLVEPNVVNSSSEFEKEAEKESSKKLFFPKFSQNRSSVTDQQVKQQAPQSPKTASGLSIFSKFARSPGPSASNSPDKATIEQSRIRPINKAVKARIQSEMALQDEEHNTSKTKRFSLNAKNGDDANVVMLVSKLKTGRKSCFQVRDPNDEGTTKIRIRTKQTKKVKIIAVTKEQKRLRQILWALIYPQLLIGETRQPVEIHRSLSIENIEHKLPQYINIASEFIKKYCSDTLHQLYNNAKSMIVVANEEKTLFGWKKMTAEVIQKRTITMMSKMKSVFESMIKALTENKLPPILMDFLGAISKEHAIVPQNYLFQFELSRLRFDRYGSLKNMSPIRSKMLIGMFFIIRVFLNRFIIHAWENMPKVPNKDRTTRNLKSCSSVLYHVIMDLFSDNLKIVPRNQIFISLKNRIQPTKEKLSGFPQHEAAEEEIRADTIITGLYTREQLRPFFSTQSFHVQELVGLIERLLETLFAVIHK